MGYNLILLNAVASMVAHPQPNPRVIDLPSDIRHGFELSCGSYQIESMGPSYITPPKKIGLAKNVRYSRSAIASWRNSTVSSFGKPTLELKPFGCPSNVALLVYASNPEIFFNRRLLSTSCPPKACLGIMQTRSWCSNPSRRAKGRVVYRLLKDSSEGLTEKIVFIDFDADNRRYFSSPDTIPNPYQQCPISKH